MIFNKHIASCCSCIYLNITRNINNLKGNWYKFKLKPSYANQRNVSQDVNTNVIKDVILYKYDNPKKFRMLNVFAICQFSFWSYLSIVAFTSLKDAPVQKASSDAPWWRRVNLGENKYRNGITLLTFLMGYGVLVAAWMFSLRSVRYLILRKGGKAVTFVSYTPFGQNRMMTVDLKHVCAKETRENATSFVPIKVRNLSLHYILDMKGEFKNKQLYDATAGLKRTWKS